MQGRNELRRLPVPSSRPFPLVLFIRAKPRGQARDKGTRSNVHRSDYWGLIRLFPIAQIMSTEVLVFWSVSTASPRQ